MKGAKTLAHVFIDSAGEVHVHVENNRSMWTAFAALAAGLKDDPETPAHVRQVAAAAYAVIAEAPTDGGGGS